jgi:hypothetical protein
VERKPMAGSEIDRATEGCETVVAAARALDQRARRERTGKVSRSGVEMSPLDRAAD